MRFFIVLAVLLSTAGVAVYYQCAKKGQGKAHVEQHQPTESPLTTIPTHEPQTKEETAQAYDAGKDCLYRLYLFATVAGVFVALSGIYAIYKQTEATAQSVKAAEKSVKLQEVALKQWVNIGNWDITIDSGQLLSVFFNLLNPTNIPLTLKAIYVKCSAGQETEQHNIEVESVLAPGNPYIGNIFIRLTDRQINDLKSVPLFIGIECRVLFADASDKHWEQFFKRMLTAPHGISDVPDTRIIPGVMELANSLRESSTLPKKQAD
ncbi:MAG TPA: hypothetical protein VK302_18985 [Terriglobales bacterium]|nr:hypothetical protein [Terriglobales bacterium]HXR16440.1 hypothetical protein [Terriglobales bacterium]